MMTTCTRKSNHHQTLTPTDMHAGRRADTRVRANVARFDQKAATYALFHGCKYKTTQGTG